MSKKIPRPDPLVPNFTGRESLKPFGTARIHLKPEERIFLESQALDIFTQCSNAGLSFRSSVLAILLSGFDWGINASKGDRNGT